MLEVSVHNQTPCTICTGLVVCKKLLRLLLLKRTLSGYATAQHIRRLLTGVPNELFISSRHALINLCKFSPGPGYTVPAGLGRQVSSGKRTAPSYGFGTASRQAHARPNWLEPDPCSPGPGRYNY